MWRTFVSVTKHHKIINTTAENEPNLFRQSLRAQSSSIGYFHCFCGMRISTSFLLLLSLFAVGVVSGIGSCGKQEPLVMEFGVPYNVTFPDYSDGYYYEMGFCFNITSSHEQAVIFSISAETSDDNNNGYYYDLNVIVSSIIEENDCGIYDYLYAPFNSTYASFETSKNSTFRVTCNYYCQGNSFTVMATETQLQTVPAPDPMTQPSATWIIVTISLVGILAVVIAVVIAAVLIITASKQKVSEYEPIGEQ